MPALMTPEKWATYPASQRRIWAQKDPLAMILEQKPKILFPGKGFITLEPWPFQQQALACQDRFRIFNKPRQCGFSTIFAAEVVWQLQNVPGAQIVIISKDKKAAQQFMGYVSTMIDSLQATDPNFPKVGKRNETEIVFPKLGARVQVVAAGKETARSISATHLYFDEMAFALYADSIMQAATATLAQTGGRVTIISTPKGRSNLFAKIMANAKDYGYTAFNFAWWDVPTYNPYWEQYDAAKTKKEKEQWIEKARTGAWYIANRKKYTELAWAQEFEGCFDADQDAVFTPQQLRRSFVSNYLKPMDQNTAYYQYWFRKDRVPGHFYATGIDLGRKRDATVIITYDYTLAVPEMVEFKYIPAGYADLPLYRRAARETYDYFHSSVLLDATGAGDPMWELMSDFALPFQFTKQTKVDSIGLVQLAMDNSDIKMPKIDVLFEEHQKYIWDDKEIVQDTVMANALAVHQFYNPGGMFLGVSSKSFVEV